MTKTSYSPVTKLTMASGTSVTETMNAKANLFRNPDSDTKSTSRTAVGKTNLIRELALSVADVCSTQMVLPSHPPIERSMSIVKVELSIGLTDGDDRKSY